jgi:diguanylate cyclase (GGDEF)-like protein
MRNLVVFDHSATARYIDAILVIDRDGVVVADSRSAVPRETNFRNADFFRAQIDHDIGLFIAPPMRAAEGQSANNGWRMALSRRLTGEDGSFAGVAVGFLDLTYLAEAYKRLPLGPDSALTLFNADGTMLVRYPDILHAIGRSFAGQHVFDVMRAAESGTFEGISSIDGRSRLYAYHRVGYLPLIQGVAVGTEDVYAQWNLKAAALGIVVAMLCSGILMLVLVLRRELMHRVAAERALDELASIDHLTGLLNRRKFFELAEERRRDAVGQSLPVSLVMIDADYFKSYNDRYGHVAGDAVLSAVGRCIRAELGGSEGLAARFGGEEFIVLLPQLDDRGAFVTAEAIRTAVARLAIPHESSAAGIVTVSTGLACCRGGEEVSLDSLVETADAELYRSKREGRNRSSGDGRVLARVSPRTAVKGF